VRSTTNEYGSLEDRYEYDAFGKPYQGDLTSGMNLGYTGKPYDTATGLYNYGYRDYKPEAARFTTVDPVRDGANWFAYVNNDPVNWVDPWGLSPSDPKKTKKTSLTGKISEWFSKLDDKTQNRIGGGIAITAGVLMLFDTDTFITGVQLIGFGIGQAVTGRAILGKDGPLNGAAGLFTPIEAEAAEYLERR
jgi:RHS repeat-associated protein